MIGAPMYKLVMDRILEERLHQLDSNRLRSPSQLTRASDRERVHRGPTAVAVVLGGEVSQAGSPRAESSADVFLSIVLAESYCTGAAPDV